MELTHDTYRSHAADMHYMSFSQFKGFEACEARQMAILRGEWQQYSKDAFLEGHFFEALITGQTDAFLQAHPEMLSSRGATKGQLKQNFSKIVDCADAFLAQPMLAAILEFEQQRIVTGEILGVPFKGCVDFYGAEYCVDTKCVKDLKRIYSDTYRRYIPWWMAYGYHYQAAIYGELTGLPQKIAAVTKEEPPNVSAFGFTEEILFVALETIYENAPRYQSIKQGQIAPINCGVCDYCKAHKIITAFDVVDEFN